MLHGFLADLVVVAHIAFVLFVVAGGLLVLRWRRLPAHNGVQKLAGEDGTETGRPN